MTTVFIYSILFLLSIIVFLQSFRTFRGYIYINRYLYVGLAFITISLFLQLLTYSTIDVQVISFFSIFVLILGINFWIYFLEIIRQRTQIFSISAILILGIGFGVITIFEKANTTIEFISYKTVLNFAVTSLILILIYVIHNHLYIQIQMSDYYGMKSKIHQNIVPKLNYGTMAIFSIFFGAIAVTNELRVIHYHMLTISIAVLFLIYSGYESFFTKPMIQRYYVIGLLEDHDMTNMMVLEASDEKNTEKFIPTFLAQIGELFKELGQTDTLLKELYSEDTSVIFKQLDSQKYLFLVAEYPNHLSYEQLEQIAKYLRDTDISDEQFENIILDCLKLDN